MSLSKELINRSGNKCELCAAETELSAFTISPKEGSSADEQIAICEVCETQMNAAAEELDTNHWRCLNDSMWSTTPAVQVTSFRVLKKLNKKDWARTLLDMMYMDEETMSWAKQGVNQDEGDSQIIHKDCNGNILEAGDTVTLIQDLKVKGANFTAKRGTAVRRIRLDPDNEAHIEGKVDGQHIVILTKFVKKS